MNGLLFHAIVVVQEGKDVTAQGSHNNENLSLPHKPQREKELTDEGDIEIGGERADPDIDAREDLGEVVSLSPKIAPSSKSNNAFISHKHNAQREKDSTIRKRRRENERWRKKKKKRGKGQMPSLKPSFLETCFEKPYHGGGSQRGTSW